MPPVTLFKHNQKINKSFFFILLKTAKVSRKLDIGVWFITVEPLINSNIRQSETYLTRTDIILVLFSVLQKDVLHIDEPWDGIV